MAIHTEVKIMIGGFPGQGNLNDQDVIFAANGRRIAQVNASMICDIRKQPKNEHGLRDLGTITQAWYEKTHRYRFENTPVGVLRTNLDESTSKVLTNAPDADGEFIRIKSRMFQFGTAGEEVWYGHEQATNMAALDELWAMIESETPKRQVDFESYPFTARELRKTLILSVTDVDDVEAARFMSAQFRDAIGGPPLPDGMAPGRVMIRKRVNRVQYRTLDLPVSIPYIEDKQKVVDIRKEPPKNAASTIKEKP